MHQGPFLVKLDSAITFQQTVAQSSGWNWADWWTVLWL